MDNSRKEAQQKKAARTVAFKNKVNGLREVKEEYNTDLDLLVRAALGAHGVGGGDDAVDEAVQVDPGGQEAGAVLGGGVDVAVHGDVVDLVVAQVQDGALPVAEGGHLPGRRAAGDELEAPVEYNDGESKAGC